MWKRLISLRVITNGDSGLRFAAIEQIAVRAAIAFEEARGCRVESVETDTRGFDLISPQSGLNIDGKQPETRFIEVKGEIDCYRIGAETILKAH